MVKLVVAVWVVIVPWYLITGATAGPEGPLGLDGALGIVGFHVVSGVLSAAAVVLTWLWRRSTCVRSMPTLLGILIVLLVVTTVADLTMAVVATVHGGSADVFQVGLWRACSITALLATVPTFGMLIASTVVEAVGTHRSRIVKA